MQLYLHKEYVILMYTSTKIYMHIQVVSIINPNFVHGYLL